MAAWEGPKLEAAFTVSEIGQPEVVLVPTKLRPGNASSTSLIGFAIVVVLLSAKSRPTGCLQELPSFDTIKELECLPALKPLALITIWSAYEMTNFLLFSQLF